MYPHPTYYRTRLLIDVLRIFVLPVAAVWQAQRLIGIQLGFLNLPSSILAIITWGWIRNLYYDYNQAQEMKRLGAKPVPRIRGKWPGNIDVLLRMMKAFKTAYIMDVYLELFQEYQSTTLNTRIMWVDQVSVVVEYAILHFVNHVEIYGRVFREGRM